MLDEGADMIEDQVVDSSQPCDNVIADTSTIESMTQYALLRDVQPIRASCFSPSGEFFVLGTNSKALKICKLPNLDEGPGQQIDVAFEQLNHHVGSIYCVDWSRTERLIASGSNDRLIKLLVVPNLQEGNH
jgi:WD40 repeat protein